jgi:ubiquinone/menaquinone biosynthesis C-methylase UbiE
MSTPAIYDTIGSGYDGSRRADPRIAAELFRMLAVAPGTSVLDVGCGTGNYTRELAARGLVMTGLEPSEEMLSKARAKSSTIAWVPGRAEALPFADETFAAAVTTLTIHHMTDRPRAFAKVRRILQPGARFAIFACLAEQTGAYWLRHYFPRTVAAAAAMEPSRAYIERYLRGAAFQVLDVAPWNVPADIVDLFWYAGKDRPELYFDARFRNGVSSFRLHCPADELESGLDLRASVEDNIGDYCFFVARAI